MYKKRFAKWGFQKNSRCPEKAASPWTTGNVHRRPSIREYNLVGKLAPAPQPSHDEHLSSAFLLSVRNWSGGFFDNLSYQQWTTTSQMPSERIKEADSSLKLVDELLDRGHGALAGRMVRKAFLLIEGILTLEPPVLIWNLLEVMHHMVTLRHEQLFQVLLNHLMRMMNGRKSKTHPLSIILQKLHELVQRTTKAAVTAGTHCLPSPSSSSSRSSNDSTTPRQSTVFSHIVSPLLKEAWTENAKTVLQHFDPQFFPLYVQLHWEACSINLPSALIGTTKQWLRYMELQQTHITKSQAYVGNHVDQGHPVEEEKMFHSLLAPRADASPPQSYEMLRDSSVAVLRRYGDPILSKGFISNDDDARSLSILPALIKATIVQQNTVDVEHTNQCSSKQIEVSRSQASNMACVLRALVDLSREHSNERQEAPLGAVERIQSLIALREYACGEISPQVMREMWLLEDALSVAGKHEMAQEVGQKVIHRLEAYIQDVPLNCI